MTSGKGEAIVQKVTSDSIMRRSKVEGDGQDQYRKASSAHVDNATQLHYYD